MDGYITKQELSNQLKDEIENSKQSNQLTTNEITKDDKSLDTYLNEKNEDLTLFKESTSSQLAETATQLSNYNSYSNNKDSNGIFTVVEYKRSNGTLYMKSTLSNADVNGNYQTVTWNFYDEIGATIKLTKKWILTYDEDGFIKQKVVM